MTDKPILGLGDKISLETQGKLKKLATTPPAPKNSAKSTPNHKNTTFKKPQLNAEELEEKRKRAEENKKNKEQAIALYFERFEYFCKLYPKCFSKSPKPLSIGIHNALIEEEEKKPEAQRVSKTGIRRFLAGYTRADAYKECLKTGIARIDLQGIEVDKVTAEHEEKAKEDLQKWQNKAKKKTS